MAGPADKITHLLMALMGDQGASRLMMQQGAHPPITQLPANDIPVRLAGEVEAMTPPISKDPWFDEEIDPMAMVGGRPPGRYFQQEGTGNFQQGNFYITMKNPTTGAETRLDGPFPDIVTAMRERKLLLEAGGDANKLSIREESAEPTV